MILREVSYRHSKGIITMTALHIVYPANVLGEALTDASPDLMSSLLQTTINALLSADAHAVVGAEWEIPAPTALRNETGSGTATSIRLSRQSTSPSRNFARAPTSQNGCSHAANAPRPR